MPKLTFQVAVESGIRWDDETQSFLAYVPALKLYAQGATEEATQRALDSAMNLYFRSAGEEGMGGLLKVFKMAGLPVLGTHSPEPDGNAQYVKILEESGFTRIASRQYEFA